MTYNTQELDEILTRLENMVEGFTVRRVRGNTRDMVSPKSIHAEAKQAILDWHNKQIAKARLAEWEQFGEFLCDADKRSLCKNFLDLYLIHGDRLSQTLKELEAEL